MADDTHVVHNQRSVYGQFELTSDEVSGDFYINQRIDVGIYPRTTNLLRCRCGSEAEFDVEVSFCVRQSHDTDMSNSIYTSIPSTAVYVRENAVTCCRACAHVGPYQEFVDRYLAGTESEDTTE